MLLRSSLLQQTRRVANLLKQTKNNYICFDVETAGLGKMNDIIQLAYEVHNPEFKMIKSFNKYIRDREISEYARQIHGITREKLQKEGQPFETVISEFLDDLNESKYVIGHNIKSDIRFIIDNLKRYNYPYTDDLFKDKHIHCTMNMGTSVCKLVNKVGKTKPPKLGELYEFLYKEKMHNAHDASSDVRHTWLCYERLQNYQKNCCYLK